MKFLKKIKKWILTIFGDIKLYKWPMFIIYCPTSYLVKGYHTREAMNKMQ